MAERLRRDRSDRSGGTVRRGQPSDRRSSVQAVSLAPIIAELDHEAPMRLMPRPKPADRRRRDARRWSGHGLDPFPGEQLAASERDPPPHRPRPASSISPARPRWCGCANCWLRQSRCAQQFRRAGDREQHRVRQFLAMAQILAHIDADAADPDAGGRMRTADHGARRALFRASCSGSMTRSMSRRCSKPKARWNTAAASSTRCSPSQPTATMPSGAGGFRSRPAFPMPGALSARSRRARDRAAAGPAGRGDGRQWPDRRAAALIFNTHGESMGRGAHPSSFADRLAWPMSPWARRRFVRAGSGWNPKSAFRAATAICSSARPNWRWRR
jgi:hypothetical protein